VVALIVTSELATNAVLHAQTPFRVSIAVEGRTIRIEVEDGVAALTTSDAASGRGWRIIEAASSTWGVEDRGAKKAIWIEMPAERTTT
jgi:two-component sensor histidine kinase